MEAIGLHLNILTKGMFGGAYSPMPLFSRLFSTTCSLGADATFARIASDGRVTDHDSVIRTAGADEARFEGGRRVENIAQSINNGDGPIAASNSISDWDATNCTIHNSTEFTLASSSKRIELPTYSISEESGRYVFSCDLQLVSADGDPTSVDLEWEHVLSTSGDYTALTVSTTNRRMSVSFNGRSGGGTLYIGIRAVAGTPTNTRLRLTDYQIQNKIGASDPTVPDSYVSVGVLSDPWHGAFVDAVKYSIYDNGNSVDGSGIVTEAQGSLISPAPSLLIENVSATNEHTYSESFDNAAWTKVAGTISANSATAPDGASTADKFVESSNNEAMRIRGDGGGSPSVSGNVALSLYAKAAERSIIYLRELRETGDSCDFDLSAGTATPGAGALAPDDYGIEDAGNGWYRCWIAVTISAEANFDIRIGTGGAAYQGDGSSGLYLWGAQLEQSAEPTSYSPTTTIAESRAADELSYSGIAADNETRAVVDGVDVDVDDWDGVVDSTLLGADSIGLIESITVYTTGERPA